MRYNSIRNYLVAHIVVTIASLFICIAGIISFLQRRNIINLLVGAFLFCLSLVMLSIIFYGVEKEKVMPSITTDALFAWIVVAFGVVCIVTILVATKGKGLRNLWQLVKVDLLVRTICIAWIVILLVQIINVLLPNPWKGVIVLAGALLNIVMMIVIGYILPGRLTKNQI
jgi:hypothetical protein